VGEIRHARRILVGKPFGVCKYRWESNVIMFLTGTGFEGSGWV
jgi:hypothetical protein